MEKMNRNKFFTTLGIGALVASITTVIPFKFFSNLSKASRQKKIQVSVHPSAVKRNGKV